MKKKLILMVIAGGLITTTIIGGTLAATSIKSQTGNTQAEITVDNLSVNLEENTSSPENEMLTTSSNDQLEGSFVVPNAFIEYNQLVHNSGDYEAYVRVTIEKEWTGDFGEEVEPDLSYIELEYNTDDWIAYPATNTLGDQDSNLEDRGDAFDTNPLVLYYKYPVAVNSDTSDDDNTSQFLNDIHLSSMIDELYSDAKITISVTAEAVQSYDAVNAIPSEWGVFPKFGGSQGTELLSISDTMQ